MTLYNSNIRAELLIDAEACRYGLTPVTTAASTYSMSVTTSYYIIFTGSTTGQRIQLPNATTLSNGHSYYIVNKSSTQISMFYYDNTTPIFTLNPDSRTVFLLQSNSTTNGVWIYQQSNSATLSSTSFLSYYGGNAGVGRVLQYVPGEDMSTAPYLIVGDSAIVAVSIGATTSSTGTMGIFVSTDLVTPVYSIALTGQISNSALGIFISLTNGQKLLAQLTAGTILKPYLTTYLVGR